MSHEKIEAIDVHFHRRCMAARRRTHGRIHHADPIGNSRWPKSARLKSAGDGRERKERENRATGKETNLFSIFFFLVPPMKQKFNSPPAFFFFFFFFFFLLLFFFFFFFCFCFVHETTERGGGGGGGGGRGTAAPPDVPRELWLTMKGNGRTPQIVSFRVRRPSRSDTPRPAFHEESSNNSATRLIARLMPQLNHLTSFFFSLSFSPAIRLLFPIYIFFSPPVSIGFHRVPPCGAFLLLFFSFSAQKKRNILIAYYACLIYSRHWFIFVEYIKLGLNKDLISQC